MDPLELFWATFTGLATGIAAGAAASGLIIGGFMAFERVKYWFDCWYDEQFVYNERDLKPSEPEDISYMGEIPEEPV